MFTHLTYIFWWCLWWSPFIRQATRRPTCWWYGHPGPIAGKDPYRVVCMVVNCKSKYSIYHQTWNVIYSCFYTCLQVNYTIIQTVYNTRIVSIPAFTLVLRSYIAQQIKLTTYLFMH